jgi:predicted phage-related endonuclease
MHVTDIHEADFAVLIGGNDFRIYSLTYHEKLSAYVNERLRDFWFNHVIADVEPELMDLRDIEQCYSRDNGDVILASEDIFTAWEIRQNAEKLKQQAEELMKEQEAVIKKFMGANQLLLDANGTQLASWRSQTANRFDTTGFKKAHPDLAKEFNKTTESRVFRA